MFITFLSKGGKLCMADKILTNWISNPENYMECDACPFWTDYAPNNLLPCWTSVCRVNGDDSESDE